MYNKIITQIEKVRNNNNKNWMNLLRLAFECAPKKASEILKQISLCDNKINALVGKLSKIKKK